MEYDFLAALKSVGALKEGHFILASGRHSDQYVEKFDLLRNPRATERACAALIERLADVGEIELVAGPTTGGILLSFEVARQLGIPAAYCERVKDGASLREFKRGTVIEPGTRVLIVDDILTTGGSIRSTLDALNQLGANVVGIAVLVDRSGGTVRFDSPLISLAELNISTWESDEVPAWLSLIPVTKPGTSTTKAQ